MTTIARADAPGRYGDSGAMVYATYSSGAESIGQAIAEWEPGTAYYVYSARKGERIPRHAIPSHLSREELRAWAARSRRESAETEEIIEIERALRGDYRMLLDRERRGGDWHDSDAAHRRLLARARQR